MDNSNHRWRHDDCVLVSPEGRKLPMPKKISTWSDDMKCWPPVEYRDIFNYLVLSQGVDGEDMRNFKSMESYQYFHAHKVGAVLLHEPEPGLCFLKADVTPSQSIRNNKHQAWVLVRSTGVVETAGCTCIAGRGKSCSHAGAILWKMEYAKEKGLSGVSCTDQQQQWNRGTLKNVQPCPLQDISFKKKHRGSTLEEEAVVFNDNLGNLPQYLTHDQFLMGARESAVSELFRLTGTMANKMFTADVQAQVAINVTHGPHDGTLNCDMCTVFYGRYVAVSSNNQKDLEKMTRSQSESEVWRDARKIRITASVAKKVPVKATTSPDNFLREQMYPSFRGNFNTDHGRASEPKALEELKTMGLDICPHGTIVSRDEPWLSASPDGITADQTSIVEVKCPVLRENESLRDKLQAASGVSDVMLVEGKPQLKENGHYYMQVQLTMFCTGVHACKFFVWSARGNILLDVKYNGLFVEHHVERLRKFYFGKMLPRLTDDFRENRLRLSLAYRKVLS